MDCALAQPDQKRAHDRLAHTMTRLDREFYFHLYTSICGCPIRAEKWRNTKSRDDAYSSGWGGGRARALATCGRPRHWQTARKAKQHDVLYTYILALANNAIFGGWWWARIISNRTGCGMMRGGRPVVRMGWRPDLFGARWRVIARRICAPAPSYANTPHESHTHTCAARAAPRCRRAQAPVAQLARRASESVAAARRPDAKRVRPPDKPPDTWPRRR